jgi:hypothetical protein
MSISIPSPFARGGWATRDGCGSALLELKIDTFIMRIQIDTFVLVITCSCTPCRCNRACFSVRVCVCVHYLLIPVWDKRWRMLSQEGDTGFTL